jgi:hypothetical protein
MPDTLYEVKGASDLSSMVRLWFFSYLRGRSSVNSGERSLVRIIREQSKRRPIFLT